MTRIWEFVRKVPGLLFAAVVAVLVTYWWPVGHAIWTERQVQAVTQVRADGRLTTRNRTAVVEALQEARLSRLKPLLPGRGPCINVSLEFVTRSGRVPVQVRCSTGLLFDTLPPSAWDREAPQ